MQRILILVLALGFIACSNNKSSNDGGGDAATANQQKPNNNVPQPNPDGSYSLTLQSAVTHTENRREQRQDTCYRDGQTGTHRECHTEYRNECRSEYQCQTREHCRPVPVCRPEQVCNNEPVCRDNTVCRPLPQGGQTCRTERVCENVPRCHTEQRCHDEMSCRAEQECGYQPVCRNVPYDDCRDVPTYGQIPYTCWKEVVVPVEVKDFDTQANIHIRVVGAAAGVDVQSLVQIQFRGEALRARPKVSSAHVEVNKVGEHTLGSLKIIDFEVVVQVF